MIFSCSLLYMSYIFSFSLLTMYVSPRIMRWGAFALGMLITLWVFFSLNRDRQWLTASVSDAITDTTSTVTPDLIARIDGNKLIISAARSFPARAGQSLRVDVLYNTLVFASASDFSLSSPYLLSSTRDQGTLSALLALDTTVTLVSGDVLMTLTFAPVNDASDLPIVESVYRYDDEQSESLHVMYQ